MGGQLIDVGIGLQVLTWANRITAGPGGPGGIELGSDCFFFR